ncbi:MAG: peptidase M23 [Sulfurimonas sp.]|nr:MAG: peptidase M23 [Sulfurimonas sp.]
MILKFFICILFFIAIDVNANIDKKIKRTSNEITSFSKTYSKINKKMANNARAILKQKKEILKQNKFLQGLKLELKDKENSYAIDTKRLKKLANGKLVLNKNRDKLEQDLVFTIAQSVSLSLILEEDYVSGKESLMEYEVLKLMLQNSKNMVKKLNKEFYYYSKKIDVLNNDISSLEISIAIINAKRKNLIKIQKKNKKALVKLNKSKEIYKKELKKVLIKQDMLKRTLAKLNIIKIDEIQKAKQEAERKRAFSEKVILSDKNLPKVKKHGSSYQSVKTKRYRGKKTIAPFFPYTITKKYGTYEDPIYGIKVFNESISLKPKKKNTKVKTVFNGKVIYADKTAVLNNIVIVQHKNGLHTIYANLSQISPNIKKGKKIKKGYTIGRVSDELIFEVTQKNFHINPIRLFQ